MELVEAATSLLRPLLLCGYTDEVRSLFEASSPRELVGAITRVVGVLNTRRGGCLCHNHHGCVEAVVPAAELLRRLILLAASDPSALVMLLYFALSRLSEEPWFRELGFAVCGCPVSLAPSMAIVSQPRQQALT